MVTTTSPRPESRNIPEKQLEKLKEIMRRDYGVAFTDQEADKFGLSMLRVYRLASVALARAEDESSAEARERPSLDPNTST